MKRRSAGRRTTSAKAKPAARKVETRSEDEIYEVVRAIPRGRVVTYGQLAELAGIPSGHRVAARAMRTCPDALPWYRVVGKKDARRAHIAVVEPDHAALQRKLLQREGVRFDANGFIVLAEWGWLPGG